MVRLGTYEKIKDRLSASGRPSPITLILCAMLAGGLGGIAGNPADILLVRMTSDSNRPPYARYNYSNAITGLISLIRDEGFSGLFRGLGPNSVSNVLVHHKFPYSSMSLQTRAVLMNVRQSIHRLAC